jgi:thiol-disulfide isomerase/thioredoxin
MILERVFITALLILAGTAVYWLLRQGHLRRLNRVVGGETAVSPHPTVLYFHSDTCAACPTQARYLDRLEATGVTIRSIDAEAERETAAEYGVFTLPTTILVDGRGQVRQVNYGLTPTHKLARQVRAISERSASVGHKHMQAKSRSQG